MRRKYGDAFEKALNAAAIAYPANPDSEDRRRVVKIAPAAWSSILTITAGGFVTETHGIYKKGKYVGESKPKTSYAPEFDVWGRARRAVVKDGRVVGFKKRRCRCAQCKAESRRRRSSR